MNLNIYNISFPNLRAFLTPVEHRTPIFMGFQRAFTSVFEVFHLDKQAFRASIRYKLSHSGQVIYLEKVLNEYYGISGYDPTNHETTKQILISNGDQLNPLYLYIEEEQNPEHIYQTAESNPQFLYTQQEIDDAYTDFIIEVPVSLTYQEQELRALVDYYIDTRYYKIETY